MNSTVAKRAHSPKGAADETGLGRDGVYEAIRSGQLKGRRTLILDEDLTAFLRSLPELDLKGNQL